MALRLPQLRQRSGETTGEFVYRRLRAAIMAGRVPPAEPVTIRGLAAICGTSPMPVREAIRRLTAERALEFLDNRRARVPGMTQDRFASLVRVRILLERAAATTALPAIDAARLAELRRLDQGIDDIFARGDIGRLIEANLVFHRRIYDVPANDTLLPMIESVWLQLGPFMRMALHGVTVNYRIDRHAQALAAIAAGDAAALADAVEADIQDGIGHVVFEETG